MEGVEEGVEVWFSMPCGVPISSSKSREGPDSRQRSRNLDGPWKKEGGRQGGRNLLPLTPHPRLVWKQMDPTSSPFPPSLPPWSTTAPLIPCLTGELSPSHSFIYSFTRSTPLSLSLVHSCRLFLSWKFCSLQDAFGLIFFLLQMIFYLYVWMFIFMHGRPRACASM